MHSIAHRIRAIATVAVLWGAAWSVVGATIGLINWFQIPAGASIHGSIVSWALTTMFRFAVLGTACGAVFAIVLSRAERNHAVDDLGSRRIAVWGVIAGVLCCLAYIAMQGALLDWLAHTGSVIVGLSVFGALGALSSTGSLAVAQRASLPAQARQREIAPT
jgi:hypothetical protein